MRSLLCACLTLGCTASSTSTTDAGPTDQVDTFTFPTPTGTATPTADSGTTMPPRPGTAGLLIPDATGIRILELDGSERRAATWSELTNSDCMCGGEGGSADDDGLLLSFVTDPSGIGQGDIIRVSADGTLDFRVADFAFPHDVMRDPADGSLMVVETFAGQVRWIAGDGSSNKPIRTLDVSNPNFLNGPNGADRFDFEGRSYLLLSHLGDFGGGLGDGGGRITLWDITTAGAPTHVWSFPDSNALGAPHSPILRQADGTWWLIWAHTAGGPNNQGTVGIAQTPSPLTAPTYYADLLSTEGPLQFLRGVELFEDTLYVTDSATGQVFTADWVPPTVPKSEPPLIDLTNQTVFASGLAFPYEGWMWSDPLPTQKKKE